MKEANHYITLGGIINRNTALYVDEIGDFPNRRIVDLLWGAMRSTKGVPIVRRMSCNPAGPGHLWVKQLYLSHGRYRVFRYTPNDDRPDLTIDAVFIPAKLEDNQLLMRNDPMYEAKLAASCGGDKALYRAWREGDWDVLAGAYFKFDEKLHVAVPPAMPDYLPRWISIDWGYSHASAVLWWADFGDRVWTYRERLYTRTDPVSLGMLIAEVNGDEPVQNVYLSPDAFAKRQGENTVATDLEEGFRRAHEMRGTALLPSPEPAFNDRVNGWQSMAAGLEHGKWVISPSCAELVRVLPGLVRDPKRPEDVQKVDGDDVCLAGDTAVRLASGLEKAIRDLEPGDLVETPCGPGVVSAVACTSPSAEVWEVVLEGERRVVATPGHHLYTPDGRKVRVDSLLVGDTIAVWQYPTSSGSTKSPSDATRNPDTCTCDGISGLRPTTVGGASAPCTTRSGRRPTDPSLSGTTSTTSTETTSTTTSPTSGASLRPSTCVSTPPRSAGRSTSPLSSVGDRPLPSGTAPTPDGHGTAKTPGGPDSADDAPSRFGSPATTAGPASTTTPGTRNSGSARTDASRRGAAPPASTTSTGPASTAGALIAPTGTRADGSARVLALRRLGRPEPVFNITVDCCHRFYANGVLSANCDSARYGWATRKKGLFQEPVEVRAAREIRGVDAHTRAMQERLFWAREGAEESGGAGVSLRGRRRFRQFE